MKYYPRKSVPQSGIYGQYSESGTKVNEATCVKGEPFPPTPRPKYVLPISKSNSLVDIK